MRRALVIALCSVGLAACTAIIGLRDDYTLAPDGGADASFLDVVLADASTASAFVQSSWAGNVDGSAVTITLDSGMRAGDLVVVAVGWQGTAATAVVSDTQSDASYKFVNASSAGSVYQAIFYTQVAANGSTTINVTLLGQPVQFLDARMAEYAGPTKLSVDNVDNEAGTSFSATVPGAPGYVLVAAGMADHKFNDASTGGFAVRILTPDPFFNILQDYIADASTNYTATATISSTGNAVFQLAAFK